MRGRYALASNAALGTPDAQSVSGYMRPLTFFSNKTTNTMVTVVEREGRGHPGYLVRCLETNEIFPSQKNAANILNVPAQVISKHLSGEYNDANGYHLERINIAG